MSEETRKYFLISNEAFETTSMNEEQPRVLVVDDDVNIRDLFGKILKKAGYTVETSETGKEALEKIRTENPKVLLLDVILPDMSGTELLLRTAGNHETVKIIVTGFSTEEVGKRAADFGADDYLVKPVQPEELLSTIHNRLATVEQGKP